jgi:ABC-type oligopeptide transport system ATPase subunit
MLQVEALSRGFRGQGGSRVQAVDRVNLTVPAGNTLGLVGESGSGKTTLARAVLRLLEPDSGEVRLDGSPVTGLDARALRRRRCEMQIVFQDPLRALSPRRTIAQSVLEPLEAAGTPRSERGADQASDLLAMVGLDHALGRCYPHELSGGQRQRAAIARALSPRPKLLVADEPVSALDVSVQAQLLNLLADLQREYSLTMLFISHDLAVVSQVADRVAVMHEGRLVEEGPVEQVLRAPRHTYTQALLDAVPDPFGSAKR